MSEGHPPVRVERDGALAVLVLDRPEVLNAFDDAMTSALTAAVLRAAADASVRAVVITGAGRAFSAGQDLRDRAASIERGAELHLGDELRRRYHPLVTAIREMPKPVVAALNGTVAGAGLGLACACDVRVASSSAVLRAAWARVGLVPDAGSAFFLPRIVGWGRALHVVLAGEPIGADEALRIGLVTRVWPDDTFAASWRTFARALADGATQALALTKRGLNAAWDHDLASFLDVEAELQDRAGRTADYAEGVRAFLEKRRPRFDGR
ncbi:MAG: enoyl-CoA hydratase/isomerase family protein [Chloroflexota bacterium]|nr:enoyl-CoA hydratase/isomerase family protein [Chloroflexota bacterium]MDE3102655.1 enoyl-CoA hydratase/isomerase family protein [Chloroflexota bacterium]